MNLVNPYRFGGSDYMFITEETGVFEIASITVNTYPVNIDWGDGNTTTLNASTTTSVTHDYSGLAGPKEVSLSSPSYLMEIYTPTTGADVREIDLSKYTSCRDIRFNNSPDLTVLNLGTHEYSAIRMVSHGMSEIDISDIQTSVTGCDMYVKSSSLTSFVCSSMQTLNFFDITGSSISSLNFEFIKVIGRMFYRDCGLSQAEHDDIINNMYIYRANIDPIDIYAIGTSTPNATPSGTYDSSTDWSGGVPTSPMAKIYDLENNVTGTYNFNFTDI